MAIFRQNAPIDPQNPGYGRGQQLPITGASRPTGASKEEINQWLHTQPWYLDALKAWKVDPNNVHLGIEQRGQLQDALARVGIGSGAIKDVESAGIDPNGNIEDNSMPTWVKASLAGFGGWAAGSLVVPALAGTAAPAAVAGGGAATTAATVPPALAAVGTGGGVAATAGSWLTGPAAGLISTGIQAGAGIYAANQQNAANADAARIQAESFDKALAQERAEQEYQHAQDLLKQNQYADYLSRLNPYAQTGQAASNRLSEFMGQPAAAQTPLTPAPPPNPLPAQRTTVPVTPAQQSSANTFVPTAVKNNPYAFGSVPQVPGPYANMAIYEAPDGSRRRVPPDQEAAAMAAGARRVG